MSRAQCLQYWRLEEPLIDCMKEISDLVEILNNTPQSDSYRNTVQDDIEAHCQQASHYRSEIAAHMEDCLECLSEGSSQGTGSGGTKAETVNTVNASEL